MTRIFQVNTDGVAFPVDKDVSSHQNSVSASVSATASAQSPAEWHELRERLRQQEPPRPSRTKWRTNR